MQPNRREFLSRLGALAAAGLGAPALDAADASQLKITAVRVHRLEDPLDEPMGYCCAPGGELGMTVQRASVIEVETDAGLTGWGDGQFLGDVLRDNRELVIGRSPFEAEAIFDELAEARRQPYRRLPREQPTAGGLDIALWDVIGQALGRPVVKLLGAQRRDRVMPYASAGYRKDWDPLAAGFAEELRHWTRDVGYRAAKVKTGYGPTVDVEVMTAVREAVGDDVHLGHDSGTPGAYDDGTAVMLGRQLEELNLEFWEEPINKFDLEGYRRLKNALRIPLASGEFLPVDWLIENYVNAKLIDIVQPDIMDVGFTGGRRISYACWLNRVRLFPHTWGTPIRIAASMHWLAAFPDLTAAWAGPPALLELHLPNESPAWGLTAERIEVDPADGMIAVPDGPGLGIEIDHDELERLRVELIEI